MYQVISWLVLLDFWARHCCCSIKCTGLQKKVLKSSAFSLQFVLIYFHETEEVYKGFFCYLEKFLK